MRLKFRLIAAVLACLSVFPSAQRGNAQRIRGRRQPNQQQSNANDVVKMMMTDLVQVRPAPPPIKKETVSEFLQPLAAAINDRPKDSPPFRIAVFPFGDKSWDYENDKELPDRLSLRSIEVQGAINSALRNGLKVAAPGKFVLLDQFGLKREFERAGIDPVSISPKNDRLAELLKELRIDAAVVGRAGSPDFNRVAEPAPQVAPGAPPMVEWVNYPSGSFTASVIFAETMRPKTIVPGEVYAPSTGLAIGNYQRIQFSVQSRANSRLNWEKIPLVMSQSQELCAALEPNHLNAEYRVVVTNAGHRPNEVDSFLGGIVNPDPAKERLRIFGVAVMIDGVNSFFQDTGAGELGPVALFPTDAQKWVLGPPGYLLSAGEHGKPMQQFVGPRNSDHSTITVAGFQNGKSQAKAFQFAKVAALDGAKPIVAETLGISQSIGLISIYVFAKKIDGDKMFGSAAAPAPSDPPSIGTAAGRAFANPVFNLKIDFHPQPVMQFHVNYRLKSEIQVFSPNLVP